MPRIRAFLKHVVPVCKHRHFAEAPVFVQNGSIVKCDTIPPVTLDQRRVQIVPVFVAEIALLQAVPDDKPGDFICQHGIVSGGKPLEACVGVERFSADRHDIRAVRRGWRHSQIQTAELFAARAKFVAFLRDDVNDALALLPQTPADALERERLARAGRSANPNVAVRVFVVVVGVQKDRRAVVHIEAEEDAVPVRQLIGRKRERRRHTAGKRIAARFAFNVRIKIENRQHGQKRLLLLVLAAAGDHVHGDTQLFNCRDTMLQRLRITGRNLNERVHIIKVLTLPVHHVLEVHSRGDGAVQFLKVLPGVRNVTHSAAVHHGLLRNLRQNFFFGLLVKVK